MDDVFNRTEKELIAFTSDFFGEDMCPQMVNVVMP